MTDAKVIGFGDSEDEALDKQELIKTKKHGTGKKSGGFQSMGLSFPVLKAIQKRGYKIPTPIQRKVFMII